MNTLRYDVLETDSSTVAQIVMASLLSKSMVCVGKISISPSLTICSADGAGGLMFSLNLSYAFDTAMFNETTSLLQPMSKTGGTAANNIAPNYVDGALLANDGEFYLYG